MDIFIHQMKNSKSVIYTVFYLIDFLLNSLMRYDTNKFF